MSLVQIKSKNSKNSKMILKWVVKKDKNQSMGCDLIPIQ